MNLIPVHAPEIPAAAWQEVEACLAAGWVSPLGPQVARFEAQFAAYVGARHALAVHSGTAALHLALAALGIGPGDEVIVPALTYIATANAVVYVGATPVFVDVEPHTGTIDVALAGAMVTPRTRAIIAVHTQGHPADLAALGALAERHGLALIEDAAPALGARWGGRHVGTFGAVGCFSFYANKLITTGSGGMLVTDHPDLARRAAYLANQAHDAPGAYTHGAIGFNYRLTALQAALGIAQLAEVEDRLARKRAIARRYAERLATVPGAEPLPAAPNTLPSYGLYMVRLLPDYPLRADALHQILGEQRIETRLHFTPLPDLAPYRACRSTPLPVARALRRDLLGLPSGVGLTESEIATVVAAIRTAGAGPCTSH